MSPLNVIDTGLERYTQVLQLQEQLFEESITAKLNAQPTKNYLVLCEHYPVFTLGKSGKRENILVSDAELEAEYYKVSRGGDVTFHGPGQLVAYPILDLDVLNIGLAKYIANLEDTIIQTLAHYYLKGERLEGAAGIWIRDKQGDRKICAIGVKASRNVTMHGLAMNVNTDLSFFDKIVPCGLEGKGVTSLQKELGKEISMEDYKKIFIEAFSGVFQLQDSFQLNKMLLSMIT
ncbi:MAG: lipoyl(octanoyl) transferase [Bacteroidota bacterium]|nr:lipoyl(octanoyl) transferase [Bacteroidota bacterium]